LKEEGREAFAVVKPVEHDGKLFEVHTVAGHRHVHGLCLRVLLKMAFPTQLVEVENVVVGAKGVQHRPVQDVLGRVVRPVVAAPPGDAQQVASVVEVMVEEGAAAFRLLAQESALQQGPVGRRHRCVDVE